MNNEDFIGNLSTIVKILVCIIAPYWQFGWELMRTPQLLY